MLVLRAVVEDYIQTREPVGSSAVSRDFPLHVSTATIRNDMAALEEEGYLVQPHTSAGRVPTEKGYRFFVDRLVKVSPLSKAQRRGIELFFTKSTSLEGTLRQSARLLAQITGQVAVVASPSIVKSHLRRFEMVPLAWNSFLIVIISNTGRVEQRTVVSPSPPSQAEVDRLITAINARCDSRQISLLAQSLRDLGEQDDFAGLRGFIDQVATAVGDMRDEERTDSLYMSGASKLTRDRESALTTLAPLLDALEEQVVIMRLMSTLAQNDTESGVGVAIGSETHTQGLLNASVVTKGYGTVDEAVSHKAASPLAFVGSIGPTHMNYPTTIAAVKAVAEYLSDFINRQES